MCSCEAIINENDGTVRKQMPSVSLSVIIHLVHSTRKFVALNKPFLTSFYQIKYSVNAASGYLLVSDNIFQ